MTAHTARRAVLVLLTLELVVLIVSGVYLYFEYRPNGVLAVDVHLVAGWLALPTAIAAALLLAPTAAPSRRGVSKAIAVGLGLATLAAVFTGQLLSWDQLALWAVTVGSNLDGYDVIAGDEVRFVLVDGAMVSTSTILRWLWIHMAGLGTATVVLTALVWRRHLAARRDDLAAAA